MRSLGLAEARDNRFSVQATQTPLNTSGELRTKWGTQGGSVIPRGDVERVGREREKEARDESKKGESLKKGRRG